MPIDREEARAWSKSRIMEEIADLRRAIDREDREVRYYEKGLDRMEDGRGAYSRRGLAPFSERWSNLYGMVERAQKRIAEIKADIEFLKSLL